MVFNCLWRWVIALRCMLLGTVLFSDLGLLGVSMMAGKTLMVCLQTLLIQKRCVELFFLWVVNLAFGRHLSWKFKFCFWHVASWLSRCDQASHGLCHCEEEVGKWIFLYYLRTIWGMQTCLSWSHYWSSFVCLFVISIVLQFGTGFGPWMLIVLFYWDITCMRLNLIYLECSDVRAETQI